MIRTVQGGIALALLIGACTKTEAEDPQAAHRALLSAPDVRAPASQATSLPSSQPTSQPTKGGQAPARPEGHQRMVRALARIAADTPEDNDFLGHRQLREAEARLAHVEPQNKAARIYVLFELGRYLSQIGRLEEARQRFDEARALLPGQPDAQKSRRFIDYYAGVAAMRMGELANCVDRHAEESCIVPIQGAGLHAAPAGSRMAIEAFERVLADPGTGAPLRTTAQWLLNIAYMTLGEYPEGVPRRWRLAGAFSSKERFRRFRNRAAALGVDRYSLSGGNVAEDFDGDGDIDLVQSSWDTAERLAYYENEGGGFTERGVAAGFSGLLGGLNMLQADYDGDGDFDLLVLRGAWLGEAGQHPNSLLRNAGDGTFTDVTFEVGLGPPHHPTQTAAWADYDLDGDLDLFIGNESTGPGNHPSQLFRNEGGRFVDVAAAAGVQNFRYAKGVAWGDYDGDRYPDLYVSNSTTPNRLYRNQGDGTFEDVAPKLGVTAPSIGFPVFFWDYDNDGHLDIYAMNGYYPRPGEPPVWNVAAAHLGRKHAGEPPRLYKGDGRRFREVSARVGLDRHTLAMGCNFGDFDNDGWLDVYLGTGYPELEGLMPNLAFHNRGGRFADVTIPSGLGHLQKGHGVAFADFDGDGDLDIAQQLGGAFPSDKFANAFYENPGGDGRWIALELEGRQSNRKGVGSRIRAEFIDGGRRRQVYRWVDSGGSCGANPLRQHIGIGAAERLESLEVFWPKTSETQRFQNVPAGQILRVTEGEGLSPLRGPGRPGSAP